MSKGIESTTKEYLRALLGYRELRAVLDGKHAIDSDLAGVKAYSGVTTTTTQTQTKKLLQAPDFKGNNCEAKEIAYWARARFFDFTGVTRDNLHGMVFDTEPTQTDIPTQLTDMIDIKTEAQEIMLETLPFGRHATLLINGGPTGESQYENENTENVARWEHYKAEDIFLARVDDAGEYIDVRLYEEYERAIGDLDFEYKIQIRRAWLDNGVYRVDVYRDGVLQEELSSEPTVNGQPINFIPIVIYGADKNGAKIGKTPFLSLAQANLGHYRMDADDRTGIQLSCIPQVNMFTSLEGDEEVRLLNPNGIQIGSGAYNQLKQDDRMEYMAHEQPSTASQKMEADEKRMIMLGAQLVTDSAVNKTATAARIQSGGSASVLKRVAMNVSEGITKMIKYTCDIYGIPYSDKMEFELNTKYVTDGMDAQTLQVVMQAVMNGITPVEVFNEGLRSMGATDKTDEKLAEDAADGALAGGMTENEAKLQAEIDRLTEQLAGNNGDS